MEGTAAAFANTWKTQAACPNVKNSFEDPCSLSVENGTPTPGCPRVTPGLSLGAPSLSRAPRWVGLGEPPYPSVYAVRRTVGEAQFPEERPPAP